MAKQKVILAIESSCDDTSISIMKGNNVIANVTSTSMAEHRKYGGIVPELASRSHCSEIDKVCAEALKQSKMSLPDIDYIAYTAEPGLVGSLHVGKVFANMLATLLNKPIIKVNHMMGHAYSYFVDHDIKQLKFPILSLVVSGGHTFISRASSLKNFKYLNESIDDAAGEALDKIGRFLGLPYPGGISIDNIYSSKELIELAPNKPVDAPFTFSGIKTAALNMINTYKMKKKNVPVKTIASSSLEWITNDLVRKLQYYLSKYKDTKMVLVGGGVSANKLLRKKLSEIKKVKVLYPTLKYTNDNAAMIAAYARLLCKK
ncbi:MAG: tRNA (adenosine(37)-N6)-threonylcarbamoyltransferase complex transferase subunit TsaD [Mycoplasmoidaceae bacterium]|nr:tRNA (adenosine(37)-N6)-threonylcarbamoyltransferase complex transferase subunit TsaD [Mycoplasmoidaceae bacterium]